MDNNEYISKQKVEKWTTKEKFNALGLSDIPVGTEYNLTGAIEEGELDSALQKKINGKLTTPATPTAESAIVIGADGTVNTKPLSEIKTHIYRHSIWFTISIENYDTPSGTYTFTDAQGVIELIDNYGMSYSISDLVWRGTGYIINFYNVLFGTCCLTTDGSSINLHGVVVNESGETIPLNAASTTTFSMND